MKTIKDKIHFQVNSMHLALTHTQREEARVEVEIYHYHSDTNHPMDSGKKYYFKYHSTLIISKAGNIITKQGFAYDKVIMCTPDYRIQPDNLTDLINIIRKRMSFPKNTVLQRID